MHTKLERPNYQRDPQYGGLIADYMNFVRGERTKTEVFDGDYCKKRADDISNEFNEFMHQHGQGITIFMPEYYQMYPEIKQQGESTELKSAMVDELSDLMWYSFDVAAQQGYDIGASIQHALETQTATNVPPLRTFDDIQLRVMSLAPVISVKETTTESSLSSDPGRVLTRFEQRLTRSLRQDSEGKSVPGISGEEPMVVDLDLALGEFMVGLTYVSVNKFGVDLETLANYSVYKLRHRARNGKISGKILFDLYDEQ